MREIALTEGKVALVDDRDFERLSQWKWHAKYDDHVKGGYAKRLSLGERVGGLS